MSVSAQHPHYLGSYETLARRQSTSGNEKKPPVLAVEKPTGDGLASPFSPSTALLDQRPTIINDPFTGEPAATLSPDHEAPSTSWTMFEGCVADTALQDQFWSHVAKIRELQSEVAKMHIAMESIGQPPPPQPTKEKEKDKHKEPRKIRGQTSGRSGTTAAVNTDRDSASDTDHAGSGRDSRSGTKKTAHVESPVATDSGEHFVERKEAIQNIMKKATLSQQVTEFHQLPPPEITFPASPSRQTASQPLPQTPPPPASLTVPSPTHPTHAHQTPRSKAGQVQRHSPLGPHGQPVPRLSIPPTTLSVSGAHSQPVTPSKIKPHSIINSDAGCRTVGDNWPNNGEIDIIEGVNDQGPNAATLHTSAGCTQPATRDQSGTTTGTNCDAAVNGNAGCGVHAPTANSYGPALNAIGGGWYVMERTTTYIKVWFWPRNSGSVPAAVKSGASSVDTSTFGQPFASFVNSQCDIANKFKGNNIVINLTFCGDWAGNADVYRASGCPSTCVDYVNNNPAAFKNAYWDIAALRVYQ
ncbi:hypothetical protein FRC07_012404 [Ceratobasidium sp. 392]|nr:hypothetical protein FRC07_012404 [Ceratobasidium sp. 392]